MAYATSSLNVVLLGKTGAGKSASGNTILGREAFISMKSCTTVTKDVAVKSGTVGGFSVTVYDTPGLSDIDMSEEEIQRMINEKVLQRCESERCVFLLVIKADRFTEEERETVEKIEKMLGEKHLKNTWILFTGGDQLVEENMTIQEFIKQSEKLNKLVQKYDNRYHVFNNKTGHDIQVSMLLSKILKMRNPTMASLKRQNPKVTLAEIFPSRRIVLLGKSGVGKSATGNTILGQKRFISVMSSNSVTSVCSEAQATVSGRSVSVVDTPGLFDTAMNHEELLMKIGRSVYLSSPGPHAFLIVFRVDERFTEQEQQILQMIKMMFGEGVLKYSIILFTHGDDLEGDPIEEIIEDCEALSHVIAQCGGRYQLFNNGDVNNREQVNDLLRKIDSMIQQNGGGHYSNQMYKDAQRFRQEEKEKRLREEMMRQMEELELRSQREQLRRRREELRRWRKELRRWRKELRRRRKELRRRRKELRRRREELKRRREEETSCVCS